MSIKRQQSKILSDLINNVDNTAANIYKSKKQRQLKELGIIQKNESKRELMLFNLKPEITKNIKNSGIIGDSFFNMAYNNISDLSTYSTKREKAPTAEKRQEANKDYEMAQKRNSAVQSFIAYYNDWLTTYAQEVDENPKNQPGGVFTGINKDLNSSFDKFFKETNLNFSLKNAIIGGEINKDQTMLLPPVNYYQKEDGIIMGQLPGYKDFNILETLSTPPVVIQNFNKTLGKLFTNSGYKDGNGEIKKEFLNYNAAEEKPMKVNGIDMIMRTVPVNVATSNRWLQQVEQVLQGQFKAISDKNDFNNFQATYIAIGGENNKSVQPLNYKNGNFQLTEESEQRFRSAFLENAYRDFMGPGFVNEAFVAEQTPQEEQLEKSLP
tara:strand:- start:2826 stop:3968 length:1143 start_codon:yes stop_codon:yes gene_type:complete